MNYVEGVVPRIIRTAVHDSAHQIDKAIEKMLVERFGSVAEAMKRSNEFNIVLDPPNVTLKEEPDGDGVFRFEQIVRIEPKEQS